MNRLKRFYRNWIKGELFRSEVLTDTGQKSPGAPVSSKTMPGTHVTGLDIIAGEGTTVLFSSDC